VTEPVEPPVTVVHTDSDATAPIDEPAFTDATDDDSGSHAGAWIIGFSMLVGLVAGVLAFTIRLPYLALEPGATFETEEYVVVEGTDAYTSPGEVSFVTVTQRRLTPFSWLTSKLADSDEIFHEDVLLRGRTFDEQREENAQLMLTSQNAAIAAALGELGFETAEPAGVVVVEVVEGGPLEGKLALNDVIQSVDGRPVTEFVELYDYLSTQIDTTVEFVAGRPGEELKTVSVELTRDTPGFLGVGAGTDPDGEGRGAYLGEIVEGGAVEGVLEPGDRIVALNQTSVASFEDLIPILTELRADDIVTVEALRSGPDGEESIIVDVPLGVRVLERAGLANAATQLRDAELPIDVSFTTEDIGGPSAGLAFTLTVTIDRQGNVGPIGGVRQKAFAAKDAGAAVFLVPEQNLAEAEAAVDGLRIEPVSTLSDALAIIDGFGGNAGDLPTADEL